jgi:hypothetical protein
MDAAMTAPQSVLNSVENSASPIGRVLTEECVANQSAKMDSFQVLLGLGALIRVCATLPRNFIAFEYTTGDPDWWYDIVEGLPQAIVKDGFVDVIERPGMGVDLVPERARQYLAEDEQMFFD